MAELVYALVLGTNVARLEGSSPSLPTESNKMRKFKSYLPIEAYVIFLPALLFLIGIWIFVQTCTGNCFETFFHGYFSDILIKNNIVYFVIFPFILYFIILLFFHKDFSKPKIWMFARSFTFSFGSLYAVMVLLLLCTQLMFNTIPHDRIVDATLQITNLDRWFFGGYSWAGIQGFFGPAIETIIFNSYFYLVGITFVAIFSLLFLNKNLFRKFVLSYFLAFIIGLPFWFLLPTLGPNMMFRANQLNINIPSNIESAIKEAEISEGSYKVLDHFSDYYYADRNRSVDITSFPSMHSAWGIIITVVMIEAIGGVVAIFFVPWLVFMLLGTVLTMQHYAIDTVFGILVGFLALWIAKIILQKEKKYFKDKYNLFYALDILEGNTKNFANNLKSKIEKFLK